ncbi:MAG: DNA polymerase I [Bacteroidota bacterium]|nr:DNA polymerase I [Bacteroidota bacterium]
MVTNSETGKRMFLLDAYALIYRSYYAFIQNPRYNSKGLNTSAIFGFVNTLDQLLRVGKPTHIAVAFDLHAPTFRHLMYEPYKAQREEAPEDLRMSIPHIRRIIEAYNIPIIEMEGFEADDVIGTMSVMAAKEDFNVYMVTPDKDYAQLVNDKVFMYKPKKPGTPDVEVWGIPEVLENFGIQNTEQVVDILGLMGDTSDNIPGCPGVGPKTATKLIQDYGSIDGVYQNIEKLKGKQKENLLMHEEQVRLSRKLAKIITDVQLSVIPDELIVHEPNIASLREIYTDLEFRGFLSKLSATETPSAPGFSQGSLFGQGTLFDIAPVKEQEKKLDEISNIDHRYYLMDTPELRADLRNLLSAQDQFCFDTETTGLDTHTAELVCLSFSFNPHEAYCVPLSSDRKKALEVVHEFKSLFEDEQIMKIGQNIKYDMLMLKYYDVEVKGPLFDTMIAHYLIQPELKHNLDYLCEIYLNFKKVTTESLIGSRGKNQKTMRHVPIDKLKDYACEDADYTLQLKPILEAELKTQGAYNLFSDIEMPLVNVLADMEKAGMTLNKSELDHYAVELRDQIVQVEKEIIEMAGEPFNISSPKQLGIILFEKLKLDANVKRTKTKQYTTGEEVLEKLSDRHPIIAKVLEYRSLKKLLSTYVEALPLLINKTTGKIHTSFNQTVTATGRLSSNNPNLQNIPIRDENGREIRKAFTASDENHVFLSADYSQIELRIMAALSKDHHMIEAFNHGEDIHAATAAKIFKVSLDQVSSDMRRKAKTANFGIIYGISAFGLSQRLNISRTEAKQLIDEYFISFPEIREYMDKCIVDAREKGFVQTILGRKRYLNDINSANSVVRGVAERNAINAPIQGSAADIIKIAMVKIRKRFLENNLKSMMILQVHDELNFDVLKPELQVVEQIVKEEMEHAVEIAVPLTVEMRAANNWLDAH